MGCHPTRCNDFQPDADKYYTQLCDAIEMHRKKIVAIGECGLDYDRLHFCAADVQRIYFERQLDLVAKYQLPLFLHCRNAFDDFYEIIQRNLMKISQNGGVVHSFDGTIEQARKLIELGFYIGINGCSLKTDEQLKVVAELPNERILVETDCPWCAIRPSHAGKMNSDLAIFSFICKLQLMFDFCIFFSQQQKGSKFIKTKWPSTKKKDKWTKDTLIDGRYEPAQIIQVLEVIAGCKNENVDTLANQFYTNTMNLFFKS